MERVAGSLPGGFETACAEANVNMLAEYDFKNPQALMRLIKQGVQLRAFPKDVMDAAKTGRIHHVRRGSPQEPVLCPHIRRMEASSGTMEIQWFKIAEAPYANYLYYSK
jgi:TRAP-type mannitol/chloroaromatic compound transport system substrate-binding protein